MLYGTRELTINDSKWLSRLLKMLITARDCWRAHVAIEIDITLLFSGTQLIGNALKKHEESFNKHATTCNLQYQVDSENKEWIDIAYFSDSAHRMKTFWASKTELKKMLGFLFRLNKNQAKVSV